MSTLLVIYPTDFSFGLSSDVVPRLMLFAVKFQCERLGH